MVYLNAILCRARQLDGLYTKRSFLCTTDDHVRSPCLQVLLKTAGDAALVWALQRRNDADSSKWLGCSRCHDALFTTDVIGFISVAIKTIIQASSFTGESVDVDLSASSMVDCYCPRDGQLERITDP